MNLDNYRNRPLSTGFGHTKPGEPPDDRIPYSRVTGEFRDTPEQAPEMISETVQEETERTLVSLLR